MSRVKLQTSLGDIVLELDAAKAPTSVENFLQYVNDRFYDNTVFHRVINGFMVQGGGFEPGMKQKTTRAPIRNEAENGLKNEVYTVAMARTPNPHSATGQFFINVAKNDFLNFRAATTDAYGYCVFGRVVEGREVVDKIKSVATGSQGMHQDVPKEDVIIKKAEVI
ncbi:MAG TPA: peptidylprolyl isomerase [Burkholderiales bacterium]|jgi:peptidyl-prolyl cis-trans isomerase B (cyclophilin B)|nr:peptidylprolyl isomerase [Burkholderiales bacterium]